MTPDEIRAARAELLDVARLLQRASMLDDPPAWGRLRCDLSDRARDLRETAQRLNRPAVPSTETRDDQWREALLALCDTYKDEGVGQVVRAFATGSNPRCRDAETFLRWAASTTGQVAT